MCKLTPEIKAELIEKLTPILNNLSVNMLYIEEGDDMVDTDYISDICNADWVQSGCTKVVLGYDNIPDWVIKIPIFGYKPYYFDEVDKPEEDEYIDFCNADYHNIGCSCNNYCEAEQIYYEQAVDQGLAKFFAGTYFLFYINGIPVYISEWAGNNIFGIRWKFKDTESSDKASFLYECSRNTLEKARLHLSTLSYFVDEYGEDDVAELLSFIEFYQIEDLHNGNIGLDRNKKIKIIDYSSFYETDW